MLLSVMHGGVHDDGLLGACAIHRELTGREVWRGEGVLLITITAPCTKTLLMCIRINQDGMVESIAK